MSQRNSSLKHYLEIAFGIVSLIGMIYECNKMNTDVTTGVPPSKGNDRLEEAMAELNQKRTPIAKGFHNDTLNYLDTTSDMHVQAIYPTSDLPDLKHAHELLVEDLKNEIHLFADELKSLVFQSERFQKKKPDEIKILQHRMFFGVGRLSYLFKMEARDANQNIVKDKWIVFNYDLVDNKKVSFRDFFNLKSDASKKRFLEKLTGHPDALLESDLSRIAEFSFFFNKHEIAFVFNEGQFPFTSYTPNMVTVQHDDMKEFITSRYQMTYLEARPYQ